MGSDFKPSFLIMGVAGSGKTTIAKLLCKKIKAVFVDADDFHPKSNIEKMKKGFGLNKDEREIWLFSLFKYLNTISRKKIVIVACSALSNHAQKLFKDAGFKVIFLSGKLEEIESRIREREGHFFPAKLLKNQFEVLETPQADLKLNIKCSEEKLANQIISFFGLESHN